jgi:TPR repeat protein
MKKISHVNRILSFVVLIFTAATASAETQRGIEYFKAENYTSAEQEFLGPVAAGDPVAIRYYANMLYTGRGVAVDRPRAKEILRKAYANGDRASGKYLANLLTEFMLHFKTTKLDDNDFSRLGEAKELFEETYTRFSENAATKIINIFVKTEGRIAPKDDVIVWMKRAVGEGHDTSAWELAQAYAVGNGVTKDEEEAFYWAEYAAFLHHAEAQNTVGEIYVEGRTGDIRVAEGIALIVQSAKERHNPAMLHVAEIFAREGSSFELGMAWRVLNLAYDRGMEKSEDSERLANYLLSRDANQFAKTIDDYMYNGRFESLIQDTEPDYIAALTDFKARIKRNVE